MILLRYNVTILVLEYLVCVKSNTVLSNLVLIFNGRPQSRLQKNFNLQWNPPEVSDRSIVLDKFKNFSTKK